MTPIFDLIFSCPAARGFAAAADPVALDDSMIRVAVIVGAVLLAAAILFIVVRETRRGRNREE